MFTSPSPRHCSCRVPCFTAAPTGGGRAQARLQQGNGDALLWIRRHFHIGPITGAAGWFFGATLEAVLTDIKKIEETLLVAILLAGVGIWLWHRRRTTTNIDRAD